MTLIQSYLKDRFFISTVLRESSAVADHGAKYYETIVWGWVKETGTRGAMLDVLDSGSIEPEAARRHGEICQQYALQ